ncbi:MAG: hypothetical protein M3Q27_18600, partial [Actinomycetota bacterium]|nr:hypothetical protein [Actinomycetota bacterium]
MEGVIIIAVVLLVLVGVMLWSAQRKRQADQARVAAVRGVAEEDVTRLGEDVAALDVDVAGRMLDEATRQDYRRALDAYDAAKRALDAVTRPEDVRGVTEALEDGRYAVACVRARVNG